MATNSFACVSGDCELSINPAIQVGERIMCGRVIKKMEGADDSASELCITSWCHGCCITTAHHAIFSPNLNKYLLCNRFIWQTTFPFPVLTDFAAFFPAYLKE